MISALSSTNLFLQSSWLPGLMRPEPKHPVLVESKKHFNKFNQDLPLEEYDFVVLDTELTGLNHKKDEIVSIGAVRIKNLRINLEDNFYSNICPCNEVPKFSTLIHRITPRLVKDAPPVADVLSDFLDYCGHSLIIGHNIGLDMGFINRELRRYFDGVLYNPCLDTMRMAKIYREEQWINYYDRYNLNVSYNLKHLSQEYGLPVFPEHNAMNDAIQTAYLFLFLIHKLRDGNIKTLKNLYMSGRSWRWMF
ncbi:3'-5' exonuclease [Desulfonatronovibrio magnus]|uniref:3'-5' exonuclease n=1 Tax=Desulfonatronovibrio magnus TaxID=698827 RepID=UPI0005EBC2C2|nr:3'-5' exonuclease [Desulfonatronovibrio magnus]